MTDNTPIKELQPGPAMDQAITEIMIDISCDPHQVLPYSTNPLDALVLWNFVSESFGDVAIVKFGGTPAPLSQYCRIKSEDCETDCVTVITGNWMESLGRAVLLFYHGHYDVPEEGVQPLH